MGIVLITPNEMPHIGHLFGGDAVPLELNGYDMQLVTKRGPVPIERKQVPKDLTASVRDGRLAREIQAMREVSEHRVIIFHGEIIYDRDGVVVDDVPRAFKLKNPWTRDSIKNLKRSIEYMEGAHIEEAYTDNEFVDTVWELQAYFDGDSHISMRTRPRIDTDWIIPTRLERVIYFYTGMKGTGIGNITGKSLALRFRNPADLCDASVKDLMGVQGIGKDTAIKIYKFLRGE